MTLSGAIENLLNKRMAEITTPGPDYKIRNPLVFGYNTIKQKQILYTRAIKNHERARTEAPIEVIERIKSGDEYVIRQETKPGPNEIPLSTMKVKIDDIELINDTWYVQRHTDWDKVITVNGPEMPNTFIVFNELKYPAQQGIKYYEATPAYWDNYGLRPTFGPCYIIAKYDTTTQPLYVVQEYLKTQNDDTLKCVTDAMLNAISHAVHNNSK